MRASGVLAPHFMDDFFVNIILAVSFLLNRLLNKEKTLRTAKVWGFFL